MTIDAVYLWCDGADEKFALERNYRAKQFGLIQKKDESVDIEKRYKQYDELRFSLRSLEKYAPWIHHVFIVTNKQRPEWLAKNPKVTIVDHSEIIPKEKLPTFNSIQIELYIPFIKNLSEHFLYLNDDFFFNRKCVPNDFFLNGSPIVRLGEPLESMEIRNDYWHTVYNAYCMVLNKNKNIYFPMSNISHGIEPFCKTLFIKALKTYPDVLILNDSPFRLPNNINRVFLDYEFAFYDGCKLIYCKDKMSFLDKIKSFVLSKKILFNMNIHDADKKLFKRFCLKLLLYKPLCFCINEQDSSICKLVLRYLKKRFPKKSIFEI